MKLVTSRNPLIEHAWLETRIRPSRGKMAPPTMIPNSTSTVFIDSLVDPWDFEEDVTQHQLLVTEHVGAVR